MTNAINRLETYPHNTLSLDKKYFYLLSMAFANNDMQQWLLPQLLVKQFNVKERRSFDRQLFFIIKQLAPSQIEKEAKLKIEKYMALSFDKDNTNFEQLDALFTVTSKNNDERIAKLMKYILDVKQPRNQAALINKLDASTLLTFSKRDKEQLHSKFLTLFNNATSSQDKLIYALACSNLNR